MLEKIEKTASLLREKLPFVPRFVIILGSGLGNLVSEMKILTSIPYGEILSFPISTVEGHDGRLIAGVLGGKDVLVMEGRFHYYEGYSMQEVTFPIRVFHELGIEFLFVSNAAGGTNPGFTIGDLMIITDHINFLPEHPLRGKNLPYGPRFPEMCGAYDPELVKLALVVAREKGIKVQHGVYLANQGPTYETPAEYRMYHLLGADAVGMSTVPEVIVARHCGIRCFGMSVITNLGVAEKMVAITHEEVQQTANRVQSLMTTLFSEMINRM